jgi:AcrR family transcriptional regulator
MSTTGRPTRRYVSPRRQQTAAQTRQAILAAARALFVHQGYVATTIEQIAEAAGVSKPTVFASVGNKRAIIKQLRDLAIAGADQELRELWQTAEHERRVDAGTIIDALLHRAPLKAGLDRESAVDILWILASADNFQRLVRARAWSTQRYEHWLAQTLLDQLLPPNHQHPQEARAPRSF